MKDSTEAIHNDLKRAFDRLQLKTATMGIGGTGNEQPKSREDALKKKYELSVSPMTTIFRQKKDQEKNEMDIDVFNVGILEIDNQNEKQNNRMIH